MPIVEAVGVAVSHGLMGSDPEYAASLEKAMLGAVKKAQAEGITDQDIIRARILEARDSAIGG